MRSGTWCLTSGSTSWIKQGTRTVKDRIKTETFGCRDLFLWLWIDPDPGTMPNSRGKKPLHSSCINSCVMSEGYRHGEFVWCGWKLTLCDWMSSRLSVCCLSLTVCFMWVLGDVKGIQVCSWMDYWTGLLGTGPGAPWYLGPLFEVTVHFSLQKSITRNYHKETEQLQIEWKQLQWGKKQSKSDKMTTKRQKHYTKRHASNTRRQKTKTRRYKITTKGCKCPAKKH